MEPKTFLLDVTSGVATVTLNRPEKLNALTLETYAELRDWFGKLRKETSIRAVVMTGAGRGFCSGGDVNEIIGKLVKWDMFHLLEFTRMTGQLVINIRRAPQPVIAAVNGTAAGAGAVIALACDIRLCAPEAKFSFLFPKVGLSGADMGAAYLLPKVVGMGRATEWLMVGESITAEQAAAGGLCSRIVPKDSVVEAAREMARKLAKGPGFGLGMTKDMINNESNLALEEAIDAEAQAQALCMMHPNFREAYQAFIEKRETRFGAE